jgi:hypothetical protein
MYAEMAIPTDERLHSERGPSAAHRWRACPGSVALCRGLPNTAGYEAGAGTVFHEFAALVLEFDVDPNAMVGSKMVVDVDGEPMEIEFDQEMATKMQAGVDWIRAYEGPNTLLLVEKRLDLQEWVGVGEFGTSDAGIIDLEKWRIVVFDWKWGAGVPVGPEWNDQAILYFLGFWSTHAHGMFENYIIQKSGAGILEAPWEDDIEVIINIEQPRAPGGGGVWKTTVGEMLQEGRKIKRDAEATEKPDAPLVAGEKQCRFCLASKFNVCPAERDYLLSSFDLTDEDLEIAALSGDQLDLTDRRTLSPEHRSVLIAATSQLKKYLDALHEEAYIDAQNGLDVPFMFLAEGRNPPRGWKDMDKAGPIIEMVLKGTKHKAWVAKWITPTALEDAVGRGKYEKSFAALVLRGEAKPQLVPIGSKKAPIRSRREQLDDAFDEVAQDTDTLI